FSVGNTDADVFDVISNGIPGTEMPGFSARYENDDIWRLVSYVRSISGSGRNRITGNRDAGEQLFWNKGQCGQCHMVSGRGKRMGPDLTRIGRQRSVNYLRESVLSPGN